LLPVYVTRMFRDVFPRAYYKQHASTVRVRILYGPYAVRSLFHVKKKCFTFLSPMFYPLYGRSDVWTTLMIW